MPNAQMNFVVVPLPALRSLHRKAVQRAEAVAKTADVRRAADCRRVVTAYEKAIKQSERDAAMVGLGLNPFE